MSGRLVALLVALVLSGCSSLGWWLHPPAQLAACPGPIPSPETLAGGDRVWRDRVRYRGGEVDAGFGLVAEKRGATLVLVGLDRFGSHAFSATQQGDALSIASKHGRALQVPPETVLRDWYALRAAGAVVAFEMDRRECGYKVSFKPESARPIASPSP